MITANKRSFIRFLSAGMMTAWCFGAAAAETEIGVIPENGAAAVAEDAKDVCFESVDPVVSLSYGSRYTVESETRSDFDEESNAEVEAALGPIDDFVADLAKYSNRAISRKNERATLAADCVLDRLAPWAAADALSDLQTVTAEISVPGRLAGMAFAYANAASVASENPDRKAGIEAWLRARAEQTMVFFDAEAPERAASNNLRAWAALAVARIGLTLSDDKMVDWADASVRLVACAANDDGSLPREMERGRLALHYHIHALGPLVITAALLQTKERDLFEECDRAIPRAVGFMIAALKDPDLAATHAGVAQSFSEPKPEVLEGFEIAWAVPYLQFVEDADLAELASQFDLLANSKMGGDQTLLWAPEPPAP